jgi:hypothetical protein
VKSFGYPLESLLKHREEAKRMLLAGLRIARQLGAAPWLAIGRSAVSGNAVVDILGALPKLYSASSELLSEPFFTLCQSRLQGEPTGSTSQPVGNGSNGANLQKHADQPLV